MAAPIQTARRALGRVRALPPGMWLALATVAGLGLLVWHRYAADDEDANWLDPGQPPIQLGHVVDAVADQRKEVLAPVMRAPKLYTAGSLSLCRDTWIGDV